MTERLIITGASKGIGLATAELFLKAGYQVLNLSRTTPPNSDIQHIAVDMSRHDWLSSHAAPILAFAENSSRLPLIHNAAAITSDAVQNVQMSELRRLLDINVVAGAELNQLLMPHMTGGDSILYVGSTLSEKAVANNFSYVTSKHAVVGMMRATCQDLLGTGLHTACICPGFTDTEMLRGQVDNSEEILKSLAGNVTLGRLIAPKEIAETLFFAAENPVINGAVLHANLGQIEH